MSLGSVAAKGVAVTLIGQVARFAIQSASIILLARLIAPADFGLFLMVASLAGLATVIGDFGLSSAAIQAKRITHKEKSNLFWINVSMGLAASLIFFFAAPLISAFYQKDQIAPITHVMCVIFFITGLATQHKAELSRQMKFTQLTVIEVVAQLAGLVAALSLAFNEYGVWALVVQQIVATVIVSALAWITAGWVPGLPSFRTSVRSYIYFGANTMGGAVTNYLSTNADSVMLGKYAGAESVGIYGRMFQLFSLPLQQLATPLTRVALPVLSSIQDDQERYTRFMRTALTSLAYLFCAGFTALIVAAPYLVPLVLGQGWGSGVLVLQILAVGGVFQGLGYVYYWGFLSRAKTDTMFRLSLISRSLMIFAIVLAAPYGMYMVATAVSLGLMLNWIINTLWGLPAIGIQRRCLLTQVWRPAAVFVPFCAVTSILIDRGTLESLNALSSIVIIFAAETIYAAIVVCLWSSFRRDITSVIGLLGMVIHRSK